MAPQKLSDSDKQIILSLYRQSAETTTTLASRFGVSNTTIGRILKQALSEQEYDALVQQKRSGSMKQSLPDLETADAVEVSPPDVAPLVSNRALPYAPKDSPSVEPPTAAPSPIILPRKRRRSTAAELAAQDEETLEARSETIAPVSETAETVVPVQAVEVIAEPVEAPVETVPVEALVETVQLPLMAFPVKKLDRKVGLPGSDVASDVASDDPARVAAQYRVEKGELHKSEEFDDLDDDDLDDDDLDDGDLDDEDDQDGDLTVFQVQPQTIIRVLPLSEATIPKTFYLVVDRASELITRPLRDFAELGQIPVEEIQAKTLPVFDNHRVARRFSRQMQRVVKVPDGSVLQKVSSYLQAKGITRLLIDGQVYSI